jgi:hypothetical protein
MAHVTNFDDLKRMHQAAVVGGAKSKAWIEFAITMMDSFPAIYAKAKQVNEALNNLTVDINKIKKEVA